MAPARDPSVLHGDTCVKPVTPFESPSINTPLNQRRMCRATAPRGMNHRTSIPTASRERAETCAGASSRLVPWTPDPMISALGGASQCRCGPTPDDAPGRLADAVSVNARHLPDLPLRAEEGPSDAAPSFRTRSERLTCPLEECESGRIGRSRKPLCLMGTVGSNPTSSARGP